MASEQPDLLRKVASVIGHELRNPLAVISNSAYFLKAKLGADGRLDPKVEKHLGIVASEVARADRMIGDLLTYSRPIEKRLGQCAVASVVESAVAALAAPETVKIEKSLDGSEAAIETEHLSLIVRKLLDNAVEAMPKGGTIKITVKGSAKGVVLEIKDDGEGIKSEVLPNLFQPFATGKPKGLGLALALSRKILSAYGGSISGKNEKGGGASFRVELPKA